VIGVRTKNVLGFLSEGTSRQLIQPQTAAEVFYKLQQGTAKIVDMQRFYPYVFCFFLEFECKIILSGLREMSKIRGEYPQFDSPGSGFLSILAHYITDNNWERAQLSLQELEVILRSFRSSGYSRYLQLSDIETVMNSIVGKFADKRGKETVVKVEVVLMDVVRELQVAITYRKLAEERKLTAKSFKVARVRTEFVEFLGNLKADKFKELFFEASASFSITIPHGDFTKVLTSVLSKCIPNCSPEHILTLVKRMQADPDVQKVGVIEPKQFVLGEHLSAQVLTHLSVYSRELLQEVFAKALERMGTEGPVGTYPYQIPVKAKVERKLQGLLYQMKGNQRLKRLLAEDLRKATLISIARLVSYT